MKHCLGSVVLVQFSKAGLCSFFTFYLGFPMNDNLTAFDVELPEYSDSKSGLALAVGVGAAGATVALTTQPANAQATGGVSDVTTMISSLSGIAAAALAVALVPVGIYFALKIVRRVMA